MPFFSIYSYLTGRVAWRIVAVLRAESGLRSRAKKAANDLMRRLK
jgi:hypothetical protein